MSDSAEQGLESPRRFARGRESVTSSVPDENGIVDSAVGQICFYCGEPTTDPAVHWSGFTGEDYLHPSCAADLTIRILRDAHEIVNPAYYERLRKRP